MKALFSGILAFVITIILALTLDSSIVSYVVNTFPPSMHELLGIIRIITWAVVLFVTWEVIFLIGLIVAGLVAIMSA